MKKSISKAKKSQRWLTFKLDAAAGDWKLGTLLAEFKKRYGREVAEHLAYALALYIVRGDTFPRVIDQAKNSWGLWNSGRKWDGEFQDQIVLASMLKMLVEDSSHSGPSTLKLSPALARPFRNLQKAAQEALRDHQRSKVRRRHVAAART